MRRDVGSRSGQALLALIALLGLAALVIVSLAEADWRVLAHVRAQRAAEAAAEAAGVVVADYLTWPRGRGGADVIETAVSDRELAARAEESARRVLAAMDGALERVRLERRVDEVSVRAEIVRDGVRAVARVGVRAP